jgi:hypothetical protein
MGIIITGILITTGMPALPGAVISGRPPTEKILCILTGHFLFLFSLYKINYR